jgi:hypothetical protein
MENYNASKGFNGDFEIMKTFADTGEAIQDFNTNNTKP